MVILLRYVALILINSEPRDPLQSIPLKKNKQKPLGAELHHFIEILTRNPLNRINMYKIIHPRVEPR